MNLFSDHAKANEVAAKLNADAAEDGADAWSYKVKPCGVYVFIEVSDDAGEVLGAL